MAYTELTSLTDTELGELLDVLESERPRAVIPAIAAYVDLTICAASGILYRRLEEAGDHAGALAVLERFGSAQAP